MDSFMDLLDFESKTCKTDPQHLSTFELLGEDWGMTSLKLSRSTSSNTQKPCKTHNTQIEPENSIRALFAKEPESFQIDSPLGEFSLLDDQISTSVSAEELGSCWGSRLPSQGACNPRSISLSQLAIRMVNEELLSIQDYAFSLETVEKMYLANIVFLKNGSTVNHELDTVEFVAKVNQSLGDSKTKRNDDRLRFVYKRAIKWLLQKCSGYEANKLHKMRDYEELLTKQYFPHNLTIREELMDTSFASKKKLQKLFKLSPQFKEEFVMFTKYKMESFYTKYTQETYSSMLKILSSKFVKGEEIREDFLFRHYKRLPWKNSDLLTTVRHIVALSIA